MQIELNPAHDLTSLSQSYAAKKRLQIRNFFQADTAEEIYTELHGLPWHLAFNEGSKVHEFSPEQLRSLPQQRAAELRKTVDEGARAGFQFLYNHYPVFARYFANQERHRAIFKVYEFLNSPPMLDFFRKLTGLDEIRWADCHATLYQAGHFLKFHNDVNASEQRLAAYVLNFTKTWDRDWGGLLEFWNAEGDAEFAYKPTFNALNIFTIPADHSVSSVASYSPGLRFSVTGWLRGDNPPGRFPG